MDHIHNSKASRLNKGKELEIARKSSWAGKPENLLDRIAEGALKKFYKEVTLLQQEYIKDNN